MTNQPNAIQLLSRLFILIGLFLLSNVIFGFIGIGIAMLSHSLSFAEIEQLMKGKLESAEVTRYSLILIQGMAAFGSFIVTPLVFAKWFAYKPSDLFYLNRPMKVFPTIKILVLMSALFPVIAFLGYWNEQLPVSQWGAFGEWLSASQQDRFGLQETILSMSSSADLLLSLLVIAVIPAIGEELLFRGCLQNLLIGLTKNKHAAVWIQGLLFGALHMIIFHFAPIVLMGVVFGYVVLWTKNLKYSMLLHFINNSFAVTIAYLANEESELESLVDNSLEMPWFIWLPALAMVVALLYSIYRARPADEIEETFDNSAYLSDSDA